MLLLLLLLCTGVGSWYYKWMELNGDKKEWSKKKYLCTLKKSFLAFSWQLLFVIILCGWCWEFLCCTANPLNVRTWQKENFKWMNFYFLNRFCRERFLQTLKLYAYIEIKKGQVFFFPFFLPFTPRHVAITILRLNGHLLYNSQISNDRNPF